MQADNICRCQNDLGEGPIWHVQEGALYWVDINASKIQRYDPQSKSVDVYDMPIKVTALGLRKSIGFICATEKGFHFWDPSRNHLSYINDPEIDKNGARFNDGKVDRQGRFWAGTMTPQGATSSLYRIDPDLEVRHMAGGITISNGIAWSPDNRRMYYADSLRYTVYDYRYNLETGEIDKQRVFIEVEPSFGIPDGLTVDSQGFIWVAFYDGWKVVRYKPNGSIDMQIDLPVARPTCPAFGGQNLDELYITTAVDGLSADELEEQPMAGDLFMVKPGIKGLPEPKFTG